MSPKFCIRCFMFTQELQIYDSWNYCDGCYGGGGSEKYNFLFIKFKLLPIETELNAFKNILSLPGGILYFYFYKELIQVLEFCKYEINCVV